MTTADDQPPPQPDPVTHPASFVLSRALFIRSMGLVYFCAFTSMLVQVRGLFGSRGILPVARYLEAAYEQLGNSAYWQTPTVLWWSHTDGSLVALCATGAVLASLLMIGLAPVPILALLWALYLSIVSVGQDFLGFQWDSLLLETGFIAIFFAPLRLTLWRVRAQPSRAIRWLVLWLLFRLLFSAGAVKLLSGDPTWRNLTAMRYHYETQPIPSWTSWFMHQLPPAFHSIEVVFTFVIELLIPFMIFGPRIVRRIAFVLLTVLQLLIMATGNFGFFNLLTIALAVPLLDDDFFPRWWRGRAGLPDDEVSRPLLPRRFLAGVAVVLAAISFVPFAATIGMIGIVPEPLLRLYVRVQPYGLSSSYGLFAVMTTQRPEITIEGSNDGVTWQAYEFKYKPGDVNRRPPLIGPHMPRLDWQMWFAALGAYEQNPWLERFLDGLLEGSPDVLALLAHNPFPTAPPRYVRATTYDYHFTDFRTRGETGAWWQRTDIGPYAPTLERETERLKQGAQP
jgi:lipase maturation factor 1